MLGSIACTTIPDRRYAIRTIDIEGTSALADSEIENQIASRESPKFLGVFGGVIYDHQVFNRYVLETDLQRIERYYRARGYYRARVRAGRVEYLPGRHVRIEIIVEEGPPVIVEKVELRGLESVDPDLAQELRSTLRERLGVEEIFDEQVFQDTEQDLRRMLADNGHAHARVRRSARVDLPLNTARVSYEVEPGPLTRFGSVTVHGLESIPEEPVRTALDIQAGQPYSEADLEAAERALLDLGVFSSVSVAADLPRRERRRRRGEGRGRDQREWPDGQPSKPEPEPTEVPVRVEVEPSKQRSVRLGVGVSVDTLKTDTHLTAGWEHQNLLGGLQHFLIEAVPGVVLYPTRISEPTFPRKLLPQARVRSEFRQPGFLEARTNALLRAQLSIYPVLLTSDPAPEAPVLGYQDGRASVGMERQMQELYVALSHNVQMMRPFTYIGDLDPDLDTAIVSYPELATKLDLRDDAVQPRKGLFLQNTAQVAGVGGDAVDVKVEPQARFYVPLGSSLTLAARAGVGLLFARNYGRTVFPNAMTGSPGDATRAEWVRDVQLMFLRGLFAGGPGSNRGYRLREIGPHGIVPFYNPGQSTTDIVGACAPGSASSRAQECSLPLGGFTLWQASLELRFPIRGPLRGALFADTADVAPEKLTFRFDRPHLSLGLGARYDTPVGPVRLDVGYRVPGAQAPEGAPDEGTPDDLMGLPVAVALGIGAPF